MTFVLGVAFLTALLSAVVMSVYILVGYAKRAAHGSKESRWLGRHITKVAASHLLLLAWATGRFLVSGHTWWWPWVAGLAFILFLSNYALWDMYRYRRWRDRRAQGAST